MNKCALVTAKPRLLQSISSDLERWYDHWSDRTGNAIAAAVMTLATVLHSLRQSQTPALPAAMSVKQVAAMLGVSKETIYRLCEERVLPHTKIGRRIVIMPDQLEQYRAERQAG